jgi:hypothetical protein
MIMKRKSQSTKRWWSNSASTIVWAGNGKEIKIAIASSPELAHEIAKLHGELEEARKRLEAIFGLAQITEGETRTDQAYIAHIVKLAKGTHAT